VQSTGCWPRSSFREFGMAMDVDSMEEWRGEDWPLDGADR